MQRGANGVLSFLFAFGQFLAEPGHGPVEVVELEVVDPSIW